MSHRVLFPLLGKCYEAALSDKLRGADCDLTTISEEDECFDEQYFNLCTTSSGSATLIIDVDNISCLNSVIQDVCCGKIKPKLILITSVLTWCGEKAHRTVTDLNREFHSRTPLQSAMEAYGVENTLWNIASDSQQDGNKTYIVSTGLFYGGSGWDFESALRRSWDQSPVSAGGGGDTQQFSLPLLRGDNDQHSNTLAIHIDDFIEGILQLVLDNSLPSPSCIALIDNMEETESSVTSRNCNMINKCPLNSQGEIEVSQDAIAEIISDPRKILLSAKVFFKLNTSFPSNKCLRDFPIVWGEYIAAHGFTPSNLILAGGPQCGQTEAGKLVAKMLDLQYVDVSESLKWVLDCSVSAMSCDRSKGKEGEREEPGKELLDLVSAKIMDGSRKGSAVVTDVGLKSFVFTEAFILTVPTALQRKCIAVKLSGCPRCRMKGFVLDVWSTGASFSSPTALISSALDLSEVFPPTLLHTCTPVNIDCAVNDQRSNIMLVEFQSDRKVLLQRASSKFLDGKGTKDQLAALKILENRLDSYALKLKDVIRNEGEDVMTRQSHEVLLDFTSQFQCCTANVDLSQQGSVDEVARLIALQLVPNMRGNVSDSLDRSDTAELDQPQVEVEVGGAQASMSTTCTVPDTGPLKTIIGASDSSSGRTETCKEEGHSLITHINEGLAGLKEREKAALLENCEELLHYLKVNVTPFLATDLIQIERTRPSDPIEFLILALEAQSKRNREDAEEHALEEFHRVLREAEMENLAAVGNRQRLQ